MVTREPAAGNDGFQKPSTSPDKVRGQSFTSVDFRRASETSKGNSLFEALRGSNPQFTEEDLLKDDYKTRQKAYMDAKRQEQLVQRLEERIGDVNNLPDHTAGRPGGFHRRSNESATSDGHHHRRSNDSNVSDHHRRGRRHSVDSNASDHLKHPKGRRHSVESIMSEHKGGQGKEYVGALIKSPRGDHKSSAVAGVGTDGSKAAAGTGTDGSKATAGAAGMPPTIVAQKQSSKDAAPAVKADEKCEDKDSANPAAGMAWNLLEVKPLADHMAQAADAEGNAKGAEAQPVAGAAPTADGAAPGAPGGAPGAAGASPANDAGKDSQVAKKKDDDNESIATYEDMGDLSQYNVVRRWCIRIASHPDFELLVILVIIGNCLTLAMYNPMMDESEGWNHTIFNIELAFNIVFTVEMFLRILSVGGPIQYLKRPWNVFDCFMVMAGYTAFIPTSSGNTSGIRALRAMRALRPLRTITRFESLRAVIICFLEAVPLLMSVVGLLLFFLFIYAVAGVQMFQNVFHDKCATTESILAGGDPVWEDDGDDPDLFGCGHRECPDNFTCLTTTYSTAINVAGFDNTGMAMLTVFQCLTLTGWSYIMYRTMENTSPYSCIYYITLVIIGAYFVLNLFLAVLKTKFAKAQTIFIAKNAAKKGKSRANTLMTLFSTAKSKVTEISSKRSQASLINSQISQAISQKLSKLSSNHSATKSPRRSLSGSEKGGSMKQPAKGAIQYPTTQELAVAVANDHHPPRGSPRFVRKGSGIPPRNPDAAASGESGSDSSPRKMMDLHRTPSQSSMKRQPSQQLSREPSMTGGNRALITQSSKVRFAAAKDPSQDGGCDSDSALVERSSSGTRLGRGGPSPKPGSRSSSFTRQDSLTRLRQPGPVAEGDEQAALLGPSEAHAVAEALQKGGPVLLAATARTIAAAYQDAFARAVNRLVAGRAEAEEASGEDEVDEEGAEEDLDGDDDGEELDYSSTSSSEARLQHWFEPRSLAAVTSNTARARLAAQPITEGVEAPLQQQGGGWAGAQPHSHSSRVPRPPALAWLSADTNAPYHYEQQSRGQAVAEATEADADAPAAAGTDKPHPHTPTRVSVSADGRPVSPSSKDELSPSAITPRRARTLSNALTSDPSTARDGKESPGSAAVLSKDDTSHLTVLPRRGSLIGGMKKGKANRRPKGVRIAVEGKDDDDDDDEPPGPTRVGSGLSMGPPGTAATAISDMPLTNEAILKSMAGNTEIPTGPMGPMGNNNMAMIIMSAAEFDEFVADLPWYQRWRLKAQFRLRVFVNHPMFNNFFLLAIIVNTILMAIEYEGMSEAFSNSMDNANTALTSLFAAEVLVKLLGLGFWDYVRDGFNIFDFLVVAVSLIELGVSAGQSLSALRSMRALRILRAFRVVRLFKLFKYISSLRKIGEVLVSSFGSFAAIVALLTLFWLVFAIMGLHVFGGVINDPLGLYNFPNFNTFMNSLMTTFNVLTMENYQQTMYATVRSTNWGAVLFFFAWVIIGKYIFLTLFLAVTLEAFEAKYDATAGKSMASRMTSWFSSLRSGGSMMSGRSSMRSSRASSSKASGRSGSSDGDRPRGPPARLSTPPIKRNQVAPEPVVVETPLPLAAEKERAATPPVKLTEHEVHSRRAIDKIGSIKNWVDHGSFANTSVPDPPEGEGLEAKPEKAGDVILLESKGSFLKGDPNLVVTPDGLTLPERVADSAESTMGLARKGLRQQQQQQALAESMESHLDPITEGQEPAQLPGTPSTPGNDPGPNSPSWEIEPAAAAAAAAGGHAAPPAPPDAPLPPAPPPRPHHKAAAAATGSRTQGSGRSGPVAEGADAGSVWSRRSHEAQAPSPPPAGTSGASVRGFAHRSINAYHPDPLIPLPVPELGGSSSVPDPRAPPPDARPAAPTLAHYADNGGLDMTPSNLQGLRTGSSLMSLVSPVSGSEVDLRGGSSHGPSSDLILGGGLTGSRASPTTVGPTGRRTTSPGPVPRFISPSPTALFEDTVAPDVPLDEDWEVAAVMARAQGGSFGGPSLGAASPTARPNRSPTRGRSTLISGDPSPTMGIPAGMTRSTLTPDKIRYVLSPDLGDAFDSADVDDAGLLGDELPGGVSTGLDESRASSRAKRRSSTTMDGQQVVRMTRPASRQSPHPPPSRGASPGPPYVRPASRLGHADPNGGMSLMLGPNATASSGRNTQAASPVPVARTPEIPEEDVSVHDSEEDAVFKPDPTAPAPHLPTILPPKAHSLMPPGDVAPTPTSEHSMRVVEARPGAPLGVRPDDKVVEVEVEASPRHRDLDSHVRPATSLGLAMVPRLDLPARTADVGPTREDLSSGSGGATSATHTRLRPMTASAERPRSQGPVLLSQPSIILNSIERRRSVETPPLGAVRRNQVVPLDVFTPRPEEEGSKPFQLESVQEEDRRVLDSPSENPECARSRNLNDMDLDKTKLAATAPCMATAATAPSIATAATAATTDSSTHLDAHVEPRKGSVTLKDQGKEDDNKGKEDEEDEDGKGEEGKLQAKVKAEEGADDKLEKQLSHNSLGTVGEDQMSMASGKSGRSDKEDEEEERRQKAKRRRRTQAIMIEGSGKAFWIWDEDDPFRNKVYDLVNIKWFDYFMFIIIIINCVGMALERPTLSHHSPLYKAIYWSDVGCTIIFAAEVVIKSFAFTFRLYIKQLTNIVDFLIVAVSILIYALESVASNIQAVKALRVLRAVKPLRMLTRSRGMRLVFKSVTLSLAAMANVSIVIILFFLIFAILGTQLFMGTFYTCNDLSVANSTQCVGTFVDPLNNVTIERDWHNQFPNFDNVGNSLLVCFITATLNGYQEIMISAMAAPAVKGDMPQTNQNVGALFWFVGFIIVCAFTLLNLYVGVIFSQFSRIRLQSTTGSAFLTNDQQEWAELSKMVFKLKPPEKTAIPKGFRRRVYFFVNHNWFDMFLMLVILANVACMASSFYGESEVSVKRLEKLNIFFTAVYAAEAALKIYAFGWKMYWKNGWNKFDFILAMLGLLELAITAVQVGFIRVLRIMRAQKLLRLIGTLRIAKLAKSMKGIKAMFSTLIVALPAFGNVGALIGLFFFMYAYIGVFLFGKLKYQEGINSQCNFDNFGMALLALLRVATGDNWSNLMLDAIVQPPDCEPELENCGSYAAIPYFLSFTLIVTTILLNLFVAVIIETFEKTNEQEDWKLSPQALDDFVMLWSEYDDGSGTIEPKHLEELLLKLEPPLGLGAMADSKDVLRFVYDLDIPLVAGRVPFHKTAFELVRRCSQANIPQGALKEQIDRLVNKFFRNLKSDEMLNFSVAVTVGRVQRKWRARMRANKLRRRKEWRGARCDGIPWYNELVSANSAIVAKFNELKQLLHDDQGRSQSGGKIADSTLRWKFSAKYNPQLVHLLEHQQAGGLHKLRNLMNFAFAAANFTTPNKPTTTSTPKNRFLAAMTNFARAKSKEETGLQASGPSEDVPTPNRFIKAVNIFTRTSKAQVNISHHGGPEGEDGTGAPARTVTGLSAVATPRQDNKSFLFFRKKTTNLKPSPRGPSGPQPLPPPAQQQQQ